MAKRKKSNLPKAARSTPSRGRPPASKSRTGASTLKVSGEVRNRILRLLKEGAALTPHEIAEKESTPLGVVADTLIFLIGLKAVRPSPGDPHRFIAI